MATIGPTGVGIPDVGDPDASASQLVIDNIEDYQSHQHRGPAFNEPPKIGGSSWLGDAAMDNNGYGIDNLRYAGFAEPEGAAPNKSIRYEEGIGFIVKVEGGVETTLVDSGGLIPSTIGDGISGLTPPAQVTYLPGLGDYEFYEDEGSAVLGNLVANDIDCVNLTATGELKHGTRTRQISPVAGQFTSCAYNEPNGYVLSSGAPWSAAIPLHLDEGQTITSLIISRYGTGAGSITLSLRKVTEAGTRSVVGTVTTNNPAAAYADTTLTLGTPEDVADASYYLFVDGDTIAHRFLCPRVVYSRP